MEPELILLLVGLLAVSLILMIRVCRDSERVVLSTPQRFVKLVGPGLFLMLPWHVSPYEYTRIRIGESGAYIGNGWAKINGANVPVKPVRDLDVDQTLRVKDFINQQVFVEPDV